MTLRTKLIIAFLTPAVIWIVVGLWSSTRMRDVGLHIEGFLSDNVKSIQYSAEMLEALERIDSSVLLKLNGDHSSLNTIMNPAKSDFVRALSHARANVTLAGEEELLASIGRLSENYFSTIETVTGDPSLERYYRDIYPIFIELRRSTGTLRSMNHTAMHITASKIVERTNKIAIPGELLALSAIIYAAAFLFIMRKPEQSQYS